MSHLGAARCCNMTIDGVESECWCCPAPRAAAGGTRTTAGCGSVGGSGDVVDVVDVASSRLVLSRLGLGGALAYSGHAPVASPTTPGGHRSKFQRFSTDGFSCAQHHIGIGLFDIFFEGFSGSIQSGIDSGSNQDQDRIALNIYQGF